MGPDCGTAVVGGVGLGFANVVRPGPVGIVAASGTGAQQVMCLLDDAGVGVSHCLGVGGRDLSAAVAGPSTREALRRLDADPATELDRRGLQAAGRRGARGRRRRTPRRWPRRSTGPCSAPGRPDLTAAVEAALPRRRATPCRSGRRWPAADPTGSGGRPRCAGCSPAARCATRRCSIAAARRSAPIRSNIPLSPGARARRRPARDGHVMVDFGDDALTQGRAHPMIDPTPAARAPRRRGRRPDLRRAAARRRARPRRRPRPRRELAPAIARRPVRTGGRRRPRAAGRRVADRHRGTTRRA